jgi:glycerol kinase
VAALAVDGGAAANDFLMQFQADISGRPVVRPAVTESTTLGAAFLAGLGAGVWRHAAELQRLRREERVFAPAMADAERQRLLAGWQKAVRQALTR